MALIDLRDAFLTAPSIAQVEARAAELRQRIQQLNQHHRRREEQNAACHYAQRVIGETLEELGYDVETGFATLFVEGGVTHIQKPEWGDYYVRLRVKPETGDLNLNVVRVGEDKRAAASNEQARRDRELEERGCAAHRELLQRLEQRGIASQSTPPSRLANRRCQRFSRTQFGSRAGYSVVSRACTGDNESLEWYKGARKRRGMPAKNSENS